MQQYAVETKLFTFNFYSAMITAIFICFFYNFIGRIITKEEGYKTVFHRLH